VQILELKTPPPVVALLVAVSMWFAGRYAPSLDLVIPWRPAFAIALAILGISLSLSGVLAFRRRRLR
jgi:hypothetical protein